MINKEKTLLCVGDALVDFVSCTPELELVDSETFRRCPGGSAVNTSVMAARLGLSVAIFSALGDDPFGQFLCEVLKEEGVQTDDVLRCKGLGTALAFTSSPQGCPDFWCIRSKTKPECRLTKDHIPSLPNYVHLCSLLSCLLAPRELIDELLVRARKKSLVSYDPNIANAGVATELVRERISHCMQNSHIVKLSEDDASLLFPNSTSENIFDMLQSEGVPLVIITKGKKGCEVNHLNKRFFVPGVEISVKDTVGAGDAFTAGLLAALSADGVYTVKELKELQVEQIKRICSIANAAGAAACLAFGAHGGIKDFEQILSLTM